MSPKNERVFKCVNKNDNINRQCILNVAIEMEKCLMFDKFLFY